MTTFCAHAPYDCAVHRPDRRFWCETCINKILNVPLPRHGTYAASISNSVPVTYVPSHVQAPPHLYPNFDPFEVNNISYRQLYPSIYNVGYGPPIPRYDPSRYNQQRCDPPRCDPPRCDPPRCDPPRSDPPRCDPLRCD